MLLQQRQTSLGTFFRSSLISSIAAELTFVGVWLSLNPLDDLPLVLSSLLLPLLLLYLGMLPINLFLWICTIFVGRIIPRLATHPLITTLLFMVIGGGSTALLFYALLNGLGTEREFFRVALLGGAVGGVIAGAMMARITDRR
jgi:hypothetical protein